MGAWWFGTVSALAGALTAGILTTWRDAVQRRADRRSRWDAALVDGLADYLGSADRAVRSFERLQELRKDAGNDVSEACALALLAFEEMHEKSHVVSLLAGHRDDPVRSSARAMRDALLILRDDMLELDPSSERAYRALGLHRDARSRLIAAAQIRLHVDHR